MNTANHTAGSASVLPCPLPDERRRTWLIATTVIGGIGAVATIVPFVDSMNPPEKARAAGAPVKSDVSALAPAGMM